MGGERASTTRQRLRGEICWKCGKLLDLGLWPGGERACGPCELILQAPQRRLHVVRMHWHDVMTSFRVTFLWPGGAKHRRYNSADQLSEILTRARANLGDHQALACALAENRPGMVELYLTDEQFARLTG